MTIVKWPKDSLFISLTSSTAWWLDQWALKWVLYKLCMECLFTAWTSVLVSFQFTLYFYAWTFCFIISFVFLQDMFSRDIGTSFILSNFKEMCLPSKDVLFALLSMVSNCFVSVFLSKTFGRGLFGRERFDEKMF